MKLAWLVLTLASLAGCQDCDRSRNNPQEPMPQGMLVPSEAGPNEVAEPIVARLRSSALKREAWFGVASGKGTRWVSVAAFSLMENSFAKAEPGFGPFGKREVSSTNARKLAAELRTQREEWMALPSLEAAREKNPEGLRGIEGTWTEMRDAFGATLTDIADLADGDSAVTVSTP